MYIYIYVWVCVCVCVCVCMCVCVGGEGLRNVSKVGSGARVPRLPRIILFVSSSGTLLVPQATDFGHSPQAPPHSLERVNWCFFVLL